MQQVLSVPSQLGVLLKAARKEAGISQAKLTERLGISQSQMPHMELNPGSVSLEQLLALFGVLSLEMRVGSKNPARGRIGGQHKRHRGQHGHADKILLGVVGQRLVADIVLEPQGNYGPLKA